MECRVHLLFVPLGPGDVWKCDTWRCTYKPDRSLLITHVHSPGWGRALSTTQRYTGSGLWETESACSSTEQDAWAWLGRNNDNYKKFKWLFRYLDLLLKSRCKLLFNWLLITCHSGFLGGSDGKESTCNAGDLHSIPGGRIPWRREWQPIPVFLPGEFHGQRSLARLQSMGLQRVGHDWATNTYTQPVIQFSLIGNVFSFLYYGFCKFRKNIEMAQIHPIFRVRHFLNYLKFKDLFCFYFFLWKRTLKKNIQ